MVNNAHQWSSRVWKCLTGKDKQWYVCFIPVTPCSRRDKQLETISAVITPSFCRHDGHKHTMQTNTRITPLFPLFYHILTYHLWILSIHDAFCSHIGCIKHTEAVVYHVPSLPPSPCLLDSHRCRAPQRYRRHRRTPGGSSLETVWKAVPFQSKYENKHLLRC